MTYLVAATGPDLDAGLSPVMGSAPWHLVVDGGSMRVLRALDEAQRGECKGFGKYRQFQLSGVIAANIGPNMFRRAGCHQLPVYIERRKTVAEAVQAVMDGQSQAIAEPTRPQSRRAAKGDMSCEGHEHGGHGHGHHHDDDHECCGGNGGNGHGHGDGGCCGGHH